ncbi:NAC domain-containing protein 1-like [Juglans microcarpa x Juglans regia]|uniref:NAC domain-containing protein 1-like n=1 Tax=Juglans microcarpa x Juglans regia TaxID=2249226 RepID=UPI001B7E5968|nr:NAC domain-containing protein 1-like [Juglans microcarpa x Juglans regia]XP_041026177.1 NAC domain-containing protein 1-like [Juglans microcarpa x Juglans regia]
MEAENGKERKPILMAAVTTQSFTNNSGEQPQVALDCNTPESNDNSLITTNNIGAAHDLGFPADLDDESNNFNSNSKIKDQGFFSKPPGYRFLPTDEELIIFYLEKKVWNQPLPINKIVEVNLYAYNPDFLAAKYKDYQEDQLYIFTPRDRKYQNGRRPNRAAGDGYWKATGADRKIKSNGTIVGYRKALVFYIGKAPKGKKTDWIMHEFRVKDSPCSERGSNGMRLDDWVLCRIYKKAVKSIKIQIEDNAPVMVGSTSLLDDHDGRDDEMNFGNLEAAAIADVEVPIIGAWDNMLTTTASTFQNGFQQPEFDAQCSNAHALDTGATFNGYFNYASPHDLPATMVPPIGWSNWVYNSTDQRVFGSNYPNEPSEFQEDLLMSLPSQLDPSSYSFYQESYVHLPGSVPNNNPVDRDGSEESDD